MEIRPLAIGRAGTRADRTVEFLRARQGIDKCQLADHATALGRRVAKSAVCRIERTQRRCGIDDLVVVAGALRVSPSALLREPTAP
ncbi:XRE family transcriptional regulator [Streptomyces scopuliridis]|uniref:XRE family transcriptional regulator n=1 Tax=Streptomyces scopuliridis TaxID=452529 RepID=A0ACD4ZKQ7_9ACTN|nr:XRE family transcriptional regulator [Streptomyces scopuliridis]WSB98788.1 XRE family transcriptional regulator [Streptomyces scopuliridis]WSC07509.1 XRE family transcriptional regulator [Streptomyces scopuliridis]